MVSAYLGQGRSVDQIAFPALVPNELEQTEAGWYVSYMERIWPYGCRRAQEILELS